MTIPALLLLASTFGHKSFTISEFTSYFLIGGTFGFLVVIFRTFWIDLICSLHIHIQVLVKSTRP